MSESVLYEVRDDAAWITLNRPDNRNAFSADLTEGLQAAVTRALRDAAARMMVISAEGPIFCAGADLKAARGGTLQEKNVAGLTPVAAILLQLWESPKPVLGRVQGGAYGGGLGLVSVCDLAIAQEDARFAFSEVRLGVTPAVISVVVLRKMGVTNATPLFLTGQRFDARQAQALGLVYRTAPQAQLDAAVAETVHQLRECGPQALSEIKNVLRHVPGLSVEAGFRWAQEQTQRLFASEEAAEGRAAFKERRRPAWAPAE